MASVQFIRHGGAIRMAHLAVGAITYLRLEAAIRVGGHGGGVHLVSLAPLATSSRCPSGGQVAPGCRLNETYEIVIHPDRKSVV